MSQYPEARFLASAGSAGAFVADRGAEVAFVGRSNSGKSSAINAIVNRRQFARTSKTPGRTQLVNFFELDADRRLVDLPGYGFARVSDDVRRGWERLISAYFDQRLSLAGLFLIVDARRGLGAGDHQLLDLAASRQLPVHVLLSKADKLKRAQAARALAAARDDLGSAGTAQLFSALRQSGLEEARGALQDLLGRP